MGRYTHPNRRLLHVESWAVGVRDVLVELVAPENEPARFELVGDAGKIGREEVEAAILEVLRRNRGQWLRREQIAEQAQKRRGDVHKALPALVRARRIARTGRGRKGAPYLYAALGTPPPRPTDDPPETDSGSGPSCSPGVPGTGFDTPPQAADDSVPAVPAPHRRAGTGTETEARGKAGDRHGSTTGTGNGNSSEESAQGRLDLDSFRRREDMP